MIKSVMIYYPNGSYVRYEKGKNKCTDIKISYVNLNDPILSIVIIVFEDSTESTFQGFPFCSTTKNEQTD